jgi:hypothetical protein
MPETIELRADLAELPPHDFVEIQELVAAHRTERLRDAQAVVPRPEQRYSRFVDAAELVRDSARDQVLDPEHLGGRDAIGGSALIVGTPLRRIPRIVLAERRSRREQANREQHRRGCEAGQGLPLSQRCTHVYLRE